LVLLVFFVVGAISPDDRGGWAHRSLGSPADSSSLWWPAMRFAARLFSQAFARPAVKVDVVEARGRGAPAYALPVRRCVASIREGAGAIIAPLVRP
jgi:hypothetical protein